MVFFVLFAGRFFVADNVLDEITFGWPRQKGSLQLKEHLTSNLQRAFNWVSHSSWFGTVVILCPLICLIVAFLFELLGWIRQHPT